MRRPTILSRIRRGERVERYETLRVHKSGAPLEISLTVSPIKDADGRIIGAAKIAHDISARRQIERRCATKRCRARDAEPPGFGHRLPSSIWSASFRS